MIKQSLSKFMLMNRSYRCLKALRPTSGALMRGFSDNGDQNRDKKSKGSKNRENDFQFNEEEKQFREEQRRQIMDELEKNRINYSRSLGLGTLVRNGIMGKFLKLDIVIGILGFAGIVYFLSEIYEDPLSGSKKLIFSNDRVRKNEELLTQMSLSYVGISPGLHIVSLKSSHLRVSFIFLVKIFV